LDPLDLLKIVKDLGFPIWAAVVLYAAITITRAVTRVTEELRASDVLLKQTLTEHIEEHRENIAQTDKRIALMEQLLARHDDNIDSIWDRLNANSGQFRAMP
jgi:septal ring factor EnvC (AmiA/AmiB activator)